MSTLDPALFPDEFVLDMHNKLDALLSIGKTPVEAEKILCGFYSDMLGCDNTDGGAFWLALASCEWEKGILNELVKSKALSFVETNLTEWRESFILREKLLNELENKILSPMPAPKKIEDPAVHRCPWSVGSLLAYRITSDSMKDHPCFGKYALLRVLMIDKEPYCSLAQSEYYNESMLVGLYGWIGDEIPDPEIVKDLAYIPIEHTLPESFHTGNVSAMDKLKKHARQILLNLLRSIPKTCVLLDWYPTKYESKDITYLGCDESFQTKTPDFFDTSLYYTLGFPTFDAALAHGLEPYLNKNNGR